ncbi:MAG: lipocalin-like domain-containing protein [Methyloceanibacter sp.]
MPQKSDAGLAGTRLAGYAKAARNAYLMVWTNEGKARNNHRVSAFLGYVDRHLLEETTMQPKQFVRKVAAYFTAALFTVALTAMSGFAASEFEGTWQVQDTQGNPFEITLAADGTAKGDRAGEGLNGTWKAEGDSAVITWDTEWTTKITKDGTAYKKTAAEKGKPAGPASDAKKVQ